MPPADFAGVDYLMRRLRPEFISRFCKKNPEARLCSDSCSLFNDIQQLKKLGKIKYVPQEVQDMLSKKWEENNHYV